jgi:hypothetical protein
MHAVSDFPDYALDKRESLAELASMARAGCDHDRAVRLEGSIAPGPRPRAGSSDGGDALTRAGGAPLFFGRDFLL